MSHIQSEEAVEILNAIPNRIKIYPRVEANWFMFDFEADGEDYELGVNIHNGMVSLTQDGEIIYEAGGRR